MKKTETLFNIALDNCCNWITDKCTGASWDKDTQEPYFFRNYIEIPSRCPGYSEQEIPNPAIKKDESELNEMIAKDIPEPLIKRKKKLLKLMDKTVIKKYCTIYNTWNEKPVPHECLITQGEKCNFYANKLKHPKEDRTKCLIAHLKMPCPHFEMTILPLIRDKTQIVEKYYKISPSSNPVFGKENPNIEYKDYKRRPKN